MFIDYGAPRYLFVLSHVLCLISITSMLVGLLAVMLVVVLLSLSSFALLCLVLSLFAIPKVDPRNKEEGKRCRTHAAGGRGMEGWGGGAARHCPVASLA
jgi:hypothetical protein